MSDPAGLLQLIRNQTIPLLLIFYLIISISIHKVQQSWHQSVLVFISPTYHLSFKISHFTHKPKWDLNIVPVQMHVYVWSNWCCHNLPLSAHLLCIISSLCQTQSKSKSLSLHLLALHTNLLAYSERIELIPMETLDVLPERKIDSVNPFLGSYSLLHFRIFISFGQSFLLSHLGRMQAWKVVTKGRASRC